MSRIALLLLLAACDSRTVAAVRVEKQEQPEQALLEPKVLEDAHVLTSRSFFVRTGTRADAGTLLNAIVPWGKSSSAALSLRPAVVEALGGSDWVVKSKDIDTSTYDFSWMKRLSAFDHWRFQADPRWAGDVPFSFMHASAPSWFTLTRWAKLRLLDGSRYGELSAAQREVEDLARIMASTESVDAIRSAANMSNYRVDQPEPQSVEDKRVDEYLSGQIRLHGMVAEPRALLRRLANTGAPGYCAFMTEVLWRAFYYRPQVTNTTATIRQTYDAYDALLADRSIRCAWPRLREAWAERGTRGRFLDPFTDRKSDARSREIIEYFEPRR